MVVIFLPTAALDRHHARAHRRAVDVHGARAALRHAAAVLGSGQADLLAHHPQQRGARVDVDLVVFPLIVKRTMPASSQWNSIRGELL